MPICLSIQSLVVAGSVGQGAAAFALAAEGVEVWQMPSVVLSGHAGTPGVTGRRVPGAEIDALSQGLAASGALARIDAVLTGYLGTPETALAVAELIRGIRAVRPDMTYLCDPVLGDNGQLYLPAEMVDIYRDTLLPLADIATPNVDELGWLSDMPRAAGSHAAAQAARAVQALGPAIVFATSVFDTPGRTGILACQMCGAQLAEAPLHDVHANGSGDFAAALLLSEILVGTEPVGAATRTANASAALAARAKAEQREDLPVIPARALWQDPAHRAAVGAA